MPLRVWLPLTKDLSNNGLSEYDIGMFRGTETYNANGKLGKCFYANGVNTIKVYKIIPDFYKYTGYSLCAWFYIEARNTVHSGSAIISAGNWNNQVLNLAVSDWSTDHYTKLRVSGTSWGYTYDYNFSLNTWYHAVVSSDGVKTYAYVNGTLIGDTITGFLPSSIEGNDLCIGGATYYNGMQFFGRINDVRIYDHALSPKEVSEIAKGLVCHYTLNDPYVTDNLFVNGFGQDGLVGWSNSNYSTTEIPSTPNYIKASYTTNNTTTDFLPISHDTTYTFSEYLKASTASGTTYPSILPYDIDKNFIGNNQCAVGFSPNWRSTLSQPLNPGDTVVHATDLSSWTTDTTSHYYYVAVFGYTDSTGHVYKDFTYTQDSLKFGTQTDKNNLDKTTNTITLLSPYTGKARPAGTAICQATAGSTYFYPFGGISVTTITDWTYKSTVIDPKTTNGRLFWAQYIQYLAYPSAYHAGIRLVDNNANKIICDSSGFSNNSKAVNNIFPSSDTPRNTISTQFVDNTSTVTITPCFSVGQTMDELSVSTWFKTNTLNSTAPNLWSLGENAFARIRLANATSLWYYIRVGSTQVSATFAAGKTLTDDTWHHVVLTFKNGVVVVYLDGNQIGTTDHSATATYLTCNSAGTTWHLGGYTATAEKLIGSLSDFRLYTTCLSADDARQLYNAPVSIANNGSMLTQGEFVEL